MRLKTVDNIWSAYEWRLRPHAFDIKTVAKCLKYVRTKGSMDPVFNGNYPDPILVRPGDILRIKLDLKRMKLTMDINDVDHGIVPNFGYNLCG